VALEFGANIGKWQLKGVDLIKFNDAGAMIDFEVMSGRSRHCRRSARKWGTESAPGAESLRHQLNGRQSKLTQKWHRRRLRSQSPCGKDLPLGGHPLGADSRIRGTLP
jgi:hypothetical protein